MTQVLILLRRDGRAAAEALRALRARGHRCWVTVKEAGYFQVQEQLDRPGIWQKWADVVALAEGALVPTEHLRPLFAALGARRVEWVPTPYPLEYPEWNFARPIAEPEGIFLGTREFAVPSRRHLPALRLAVRLAAETGRPLRLLDDGSCPGWLRRELRQEPVRMEWIRAPLAYPEYLQLLAQHEVVFQLDRSGVPGQVAGDCALAGVLLIGGDGTNESLLFSETCGVGRGEAELVELVRRALLDLPWREQALRRVAERGRNLLSYAAGRENLAALVGDQLE